VVAKAEKLADEYLEKNYEKDQESMMAPITSAEDKSYDKPFTEISQLKMKVANWKRELQEEAKKFLTIRLLVLQKQISGANLDNFDNVCLKPYLQVTQSIPRGQNHNIYGNTLRSPNSLASVSCLA